MLNKDAWIEINLNNIRHNTRIVKKYIGGKTKILAMVKADGYAHGYIEIAKIFHEEGIDYLGITNLDQGFEIRKEIPEICILNTSHANPSYYSKLGEFKIDQMIGSYEEAKAISESTDCEVCVHINVDTGMGRTGFLFTDDYAEEILKVSNLKNIRVKGLMSHLSCSEVEDDTYNLEQLEKFKVVVSTLKEKGLEFEIIHIANTGAIARFGKPYYDMVRAGMVLYGIKPDFSGELETLGFKEAMEIKARIMNIREIPPGSCIGYDATYTTTKTEKIATLNIGYYDGISQRIDKGFKVLVNGVYCPIVGVICLNNCMVDVSEVEGVKIGDTVTFMGHSGDKFTSVYEMAKAQNMYPLEVCCRVSARLDAIYKGKK